MAECKSIKVLVLIVPIQSFIMDRANPIFHLVLSIQERFPNTFNPEYQNESDNIIILITKCDQVKRDVLEGLRNGHRIE